MLKISKLGVSSKTEKVLLGFGIGVIEKMGLNINFEVKPKYHFVMTFNLFKLNAKTTYSSIRLI